jgi:LysR family glycine cleavage system transcriptional activator
MYVDSGMTESDVEMKFCTTDADLATVTGSPLMRDRVLPLASPALLARLPPLKSPADLANTPRLRTPLEPWAPWFAAAGLAWGEPTQGPKLVDLGLTLEAAVSGQGVALARPSLARHWLAAGTLVAPFSIQAIPARTA